MCRADGVSLLYGWWLDMVKVYLGNVVCKYTILVVEEFWVICMRNGWMMKIISIMIYGGIWWSAKMVREWEAFERVDWSASFRIWLGFSELWSEHVHVHLLHMRRIMFRIIVNGYYYYYWWSLYSSSKDVGAWWRYILVLLNNITIRKLCDII